ncbi:hypothetical protein P154DRAFT_619830 [Amniculicola lignicola CBS 123094]|uniref:G-protein coupled receptors family 2 profile 2 domain-containing protein n=1 Tax=Amniculicola lignicola CBS 123094 TaxID=1392246 RepID=A0A6A5WJE8_9PLEO|nr:hypothetical protein P154DRAFT_619830 [Amniculicola lignicola CBS 123094]
MVATALVWMSLLISALAVPLNEEPVRTVAVARDEYASPPPRGPHNGNVPRARLTVTCVAFFCVLLLAFMMGFRAQRLGNTKLKFAHILVYIQSFLACSFIISSTILSAGYGLATQPQCFAAIVICQVFYTLAKLNLYIFLLERFHILRAPFIHHRTHDYIWLALTLITILPFSAISIITYLTPHASIHADGRCRIGIAPIPSYLLLGFDAVIQALLTGVFVWLLWPMVGKTARRRGGEGDYAGVHGYGEPRPSLIGGRLQRKMTQINWFGRKKTSCPQERERVAVNFSAHMRILLWRNVIGSFLIFIGSTVNMVVFYADGKAQLGWVCMLWCVADITWGALIVQWLTLGACSTSTSSSTTSASQPETASIPVLFSRRNTRTLECPLTLDRASLLDHVSTMSQPVTPLFIEKSMERKASPLI